MDGSAGCTKVGIMCEVASGGINRGLCAIKSAAKLILFLLLIPAIVIAADLKVYKDSYIVEFDDEQVMALGGGVSAASRANALGLELKEETTHAKLVQRRADTLALSSESVSQIETYDADEVQRFCSGLSGVKYCEPNYVIQAEAVPNDTNYTQLWGMKPGIAGLDAQSAWDLSTGSSQVVVAIIDTGIDYNHPDLSANVWRNPGEVAGNGVDDDHNGVIDDVYGYNAIGNNGDPMDYNGHGTHVAGTIGGVGNNGKGVAGVNWNVKLMASRFLNANGSGSLFDAVKALDYVTRQVQAGTKVVLSNNSWGGGGYSQSLFDAIKRANDAGVIFVAAAGNEANDNDASPHYPSSYDLPNVVGVAAIDSQGNLASFSNYGASSVDIAAPGVGIVSTYLSGQYASLSGTSMATPHVAGVLALLKGYEPTLGMSALIDRLYLSGTGLPTLSSVIRTGRRADAYRMLTGQTAPITPPTGAADYAYDVATVSYAPNTAVKNSAIKLQADEGYHTYKLPFGFMFYGEVKNKIYISANGVIYFEKPSSMDFQNSSIAPKNSIAALHIDMISDKSPLGVRVKSYSDKVVVYWNSKLYSAQGAGTVQAWAELRQDGTILTSYGFSSGTVQSSAQSAAKGIRGNFAAHTDSFNQSVSSGMTVQYTPLGGENGLLSFTQAPSSVVGQKNYTIDVSGSQGTSGSLRLAINGHECAIGDLQVSSAGAAELGLKMANRPFKGKISLLLRAGAFVQSVRSASYKPAKNFYHKFRGRIKNTNQLKQKDVDRMCEMLEKTVYQVH